MSTALSIRPARSRRPQTYVPTHEEIARECEQIRAGWSPAELRCREVKSHFGWTVPERRRGAECDEFDGES